MRGKPEGSRKRGRPNLRWTDSLKEATGVNLQELSRAVEDRIFRIALIHWVAISQKQLDGTYSNNKQVFGSVYEVSAIFKSG